VPHTSRAYRLFNGVTGLAQRVSLAEAELAQIHGTIEVANASTVVGIHPICGPVDAESWRLHLY
jgi:hypothetical protein